MKFYGLRPWDLDEMWPAEIAEYVRFYNAWQAEQRR